MLIPRWFARLLVPGLIAQALVVSATQFYVSPQGHDRWSGRLDKPADNQSDGPKATLASALQAARAARQASADDPITIHLRAGTYFLEQPITLTAADSGTSPQRPFLIQAAPGESPTLSGGRLLGGWQRAPGRPGLWQTEIPEVRDGKWFFRQLFINGQRKQRARTPNAGFFRIQGASPQGNPVQLNFQNGDIQAAWAKDGGVEVVALLSWADFRMQIRSVDEDQNLATLSGEPRPSNREANARYYVENAPDALDAPGEWFLDRKTGLLSYQAEPGEDLSTAQVIAPQLAELLVLAGDVEARQPIRHVVLRGLTFSHTDWTLPESGYADTQSAIAIRGGVRAEAAVDCRIEDCTFSHLAGYALELGRACQRNTVVGNEMFDLGAGGIRIGETSKRLDEFDRNFGQTVTDNHIHRLGRVYAPGVGVFILQSGQNRVAHNHIHDLYYTAVSVGWNWGYQETPCRENVIEFNHLHDIGQSMLSDMGAVYTLGIQRGTVIRNNLIHDVNSFSYGGWGLYPDEGSTSIVWENNLVYRTKSAGFHQHYGRENVVRNNIFAYGKERQLMRTREESHLSFIFTNNIVYFDSGELLGSNWENDQFILNANLYFDARPGRTPDTLRFSSDTLDEWRQRGHDTNSLVADPMFVAPEKSDFSLRGNSPALKLGFQPIDLTQVGVRPKSRR